MFVRSSFSNRESAPLSLVTYSQFVGKAISRHWGLTGVVTQWEWDLWGFIGLMGIVREEFFAVGADDELAAVMRGAGWDETALEVVILCLLGWICGESWDG